MSPSWRPTSGVLLRALLCLTTALLSADRANAGNIDLSIRADPIPAGEAGRRADRRSTLAGGPAVGGRRRPKLINFSTDSSQIGVELGFTVPLLKVPLAGARTGPGQGPGGPGGALFKEPIDVNIGALFVAGSMLATVMGIVPAIYSAFAKPKPVPASVFKSAPESRAEDVGWMQKATRLLGTAEEALARRGVDAWSCGGRALCSALAGAADRVRDGRAGSLDLVLHGLARSPWVADWVSGTKLQNAASGEEDTDHCVHRFTRCQLPRELTSLLSEARDFAAGNDVS